MRYLERIAGWLVTLFGAAHLLVGRAAFIDPTERRVWFASAGFLLIVAGLANLAAEEGRSRMAAAAGLAGGLSILAIGGLLLAADGGLAMQPQTWLLLALGLLLSVARLRDLAA